MTRPDWFIAEVKSSFWHAWRLWRPMYILTGIAIAGAVLLVLADLAWRALP